MPFAVGPIEASTTPILPPRKGILVLRHAQPTQLIGGSGLSYQATLNYTDLAGKNTYDDPPLLLDLKVLQNTIVGSDHMAELSSSLKEIRKLMKRWNGPGALEVLSSDGDKRQRAQNRLDHRWDVRHAYRERGVRGVAAEELARLKRRLRD